MGNAVSASVDIAMGRAAEMARARGRESPVLEELLLVLLDDESVQEMLANQSVDIEALRVSLQSHLEEKTGFEAKHARRRDPELGNVLRRAVMKNMISNKQEAEPTDVIVAILVERGGYAARLLSELGLTIDEAENEALSGFLARQKEQVRRIEEVEARIAEERARQPRGRAILSDSISEASGASVGPRRYVLRVASRNSPSETRFKAAVSCDGRLDLYIESTPFEIEFGALRVTALFEAIDDDGSLKVELITETNGRRRPVLGFGGRSGVLLEDATDPSGRRSGSL